MSGGHGESKDRGRDTVGRLGVRGSERSQESERVGSWPARNDGSPGTWWEAEGLSLAR
jgi:hypothetical protein